MGEGAGVRRARALGPRGGTRRARSTARSSATAATPTRTTSPRRRPAVRAPPRACSSRSTTPASTPRAIGARERARHVDAAQRRGRGRGDPQGVRRRRAAGHVDQGRHRPPGRRRRRGRSGDLPARAARRRGAAHREPRARSATTSSSTSSPASRGRSRRAPALSNSFGFGGHNATADLRARLVTSTIRATAPTPSVGHRSTAAVGRGARGRRPPGRLVPHRGRQAPRRDRPPEGEHHRAGRAARRRARDPARRRARHVGRRLREGVSALHAWGRHRQGARSTRRASCRRCSCVTGPACPARRSLLGIASTSRDVPTTRSPTSPAPTRSPTFTGEPITSDRARRRRGARAPERGRGAGRRRRGRRRSGAGGAPLLPPRPPPRRPAGASDIDDPVDRPCARAATAVPARADRVVRRAHRDRRRRATSDSFLELRAGTTRRTWSPRSPRSTGDRSAIVANQPMYRAGTLDIEASRKAARFVAVVRRVQPPDRHVRRHARASSRAATSSGAA